jgi:hypothetical protein
VRSWQHGRPEHLSPEQPESGFRVVCETSRQFTRSRADSRRDHRGAELSHNGNAVRQTCERRPHDVRAMAAMSERENTDAAKADPDAQSLGVLEKRQIVFPEQAAGHVAGGPRRLDWFRDQKATLPVADERCPALLHGGAQAQ